MSTTTLTTRWHNLDRDRCIVALREIMRV